MRNEERAVTADRYSWLHDWRFSILPTIKHRKSDQQNTSARSLHWLVFRIWTMDSFEFSIEATVSHQIELRLQVPYLIAGIFIPVVPIDWNMKLWRRPKRRGLG